MVDPLGPERTVEIDGNLYDPASFGCCFKCGGIPAVSSQRVAEIEMSILKKKEKNTLATTSIKEASSSNDEHDKTLPTPLSSKTTVEQKEGTPVNRKSAVLD